MDFLTGSVEAYLDLGRDDDNSLRPSSYSAGYRLIGTGEIVCAVKLPVSIAESAILRRSKITITLAPAGHVEVSAGGLAANEPIDDLVARCSNGHPGKSSFGRSDDLGFEILTASSRTLGGSREGSNRTGANVPVGTSVKSVGMLPPTECRLRSDQPRDYSSKRSHRAFLLGARTVLSVNAPNFRGDSICSGIPRADSHPFLGRRRKTDNGAPLSGPGA